jgi:pyrroline-5-carboxylate reductase
MSQITFIGGGNMASAIIGGLTANGMAPDQITVVDPNAEQRAKLAAELGVVVSDDAATAVRAASTIVLAVKPQIIATVAAQLPSLEGKLILSIAAGTTIATLEGHFGPVAIARTMPNTPALLRLGATGLYLNDKATAAQRAQAKTIIEAFGICVEVEREDLLDAVTAVSGSGPAYYFLMIEEMIASGVALGLSEEAATALTLQTALGAASMAAQGDVPADELRRRVTSPNGTTHAAITTFQAEGYGAIVKSAMTACRDRAVELGKN